MTEIDQLKQRVAELKPCPFCGAEARLAVMNNSTSWVECETCEATGPKFASEYTAIHIWNEPKRAGGPNDQ